MTANFFRENNRKNKRSNFKSSGTVRLYVRTYRIQNYNGFELIIFFLEIVEFQIVSRKPDSLETFSAKIVPRQCTQLTYRGIIS